MKFYTKAQLDALYQPFSTSMPPLIEYVKAKAEDGCPGAKIALEIWDRNRPSIAPTRRFTPRGPRG